MAKNLYLARILAVTERIAEEIASTQKLIAVSQSVLSKHVPNTFLGRQTQPLFPKQDESPRSGANCDRCGAATKIVATLGPMRGKTNRASQCPACKTIYWDD